MTATASQTAALETAFAAFSQRSAMLERSYQELQDNVASLTSELQAAHSAHLVELREKNRLAERHARTLEALPGAVVVLDRDGVVRERNERAAELFGTPLIGLAWAEIARREFASNEVTDGDLQLAGGRVLSLKRRRLGAEEGDILLLTDVTEQRRMAELLGRQERLSAMGEMTARLAHQIRTPLASALLYASQLTPDGNARDSAGARIVARLRELDRLVNDMLRYAGGARSDEQIIDVTAFLAEVAETGREQINYEQQLSVELSRPNLFITGNRGALKGALLNLLDNAAAASSTGGRIELSALANDDQVSLAVCDNGHGISADQRAQVFEPFFTTRPHGTGLGLAVVRSVAEAHDAKLALHSDSSGTTVSLTLPRADAVASDATSTGESSHV